jgi:hypothetical protein
MLQPIKPKVPVLGLLVLVGCAGFACWVGIAGLVQGSVVTKSASFVSLSDHPFLYAFWEIFYLGLGGFLAYVSIYCFVVLAKRFRAWKAATLSETAEQGNAEDSGTLRSSRSPTSAGNVTEP